MSAPTREERRKCHAARDSYFACLRLNGNDESKCPKEKDHYTSVCPAAWVSYFARKQLYDDYKKKLNEEGFILTDELSSKNKQ